jgi:hypothetical protein
MIAIETLGERVEDDSICAGDCLSADALEECDRWEIRSERKMEQDRATEITELHETVDVSRQVCSVVATGRRCPFAHVRGGLSRQRHDSSRKRAHSQC